MLAHGYADFIVAPVIGHNRLTVLFEAHNAVHIQVAPLHRIVGAVIVHIAADRERRVILKIGIAVYQRVVTYITQMLRRIKLMLSRFRDDGVCGAVT